MFKKKPKIPPTKGEKTEEVSVPTKIDGQQEEEKPNELSTGDLNHFETGVYQRFNIIGELLAEIKEEQTKIKEMIEKEISQ